MSEDSFADSSEPPDLMVRGLAAVCRRSRGLLRGLLLLKADATRLHQPDRHLLDVAVLTSLIIDPLRKIGRLPAGPGVLPDQHRAGRVRSQALSQCVEILVVEQVAMMGLTVGVG